MTKETFSRIQHRHRGQWKEKAIRLAILAVDNAAISSGKACEILEISRSDFEEIRNRSAAKKRPKKEEGV